MNVTGPNLKDVAGPITQVSENKRKAMEASPEPTVSPTSPPPFLSKAFDSRPLKETSSSSLALHTNSPTSSFTLPLPNSYPPSSSTSSSFVELDPALILENQRLSQQLNDSHEDLALERSVATVRLGPVPVPLRA